MATPEKESFIGASKIAQFLKLYFEICSQQDILKVEALPWTESIGASGK